MANVKSTNAKSKTAPAKEESLFELLQRYNKMAYKNVINPNRNGATKKQKQDYNNCTHCNYCSSIGWNSCNDAKYCKERCESYV